jgi:hypothetical protein
LIKSSLQIHHGFTLETKTMLFKRHLKCAINLIDWYIIFSLN